MYAGNRRVLGWPLRRFVGEYDSLLYRHAADQFGRKVCRVRDESGVVSRLDRAHRSDGHVGAIPARGVDQRLQVGARRTADVRRGRADSAPQVGAALCRKAFDHARDLCGVAAEDEPQRTAHALIEHRQEVVRCAFEGYGLGTARANTHRFGSKYALSNPYPSIASQRSHGRSGSESNCGIARDHNDRGSRASTSPQPIYANIA